MYIFIAVCMFLLCIFLIINSVYSYVKSSWVEIIREFGTYNNSHKDLKLDVCNIHLSCLAWGMNPIITVSNNLSFCDIRDAIEPIRKKYMNEIRQKELRKEQNKLKFIKHLKNRINAT